MCVETLSTGLIFLSRLIWGVTWLGFLGKNECFPIYLHRNSRNVCFNHQEMVCFSELINLRGHMPRFTWKMNIFSINLLGNCINGCWNSQNRARFSKMIDLRGHMPRFTWKWTFSHLSPLKCQKCVLKPSAQGLFFWDNQFEGSHA